MMVAMVVMVVVMVVMMIIEIIRDDNGGDSNAGTGAKEET